MPRFALILLVLLFASPTFAKSVAVSWAQSTEYTDSSKIGASEITGNRVAWGTCASSAFTKAGEHKLPPSTSDTIELSVGTWCVMVTTSSAKGESELTVPSFVTVAADPTCPGAPAVESRQQTCPAPTIGSYTQTHSWSGAPAPACWTADPWMPATPPVGVCATAVLVTAATSAYELRSATLPLALVGLVPTGITCGPETMVRNGVKYCRVGKAAVDMVVWPQNLAGTDYWVKASP